MGNYVSKEALICDIRKLGISCGDVVLIRAALSAVGKLQNGPLTLIEAFLDVIGIEGTLVSLSFTNSFCLKRPDPNKPFRFDTPTYAGAIPRSMLKYPGAERSRHPTCSYVAIGKYSKFITKDHGPESPAYEPIRKIIILNGKMILVGCVSSSPGFTTTHLAEYDLGLYKRIIFPSRNSVYYEDNQGSVKLFKRKDLGFCSNSFYKFYSYYVKAGILRSGLIGYAYSILVPAKEAYSIEKQILSKNPKFNVCDDPLCFLCNARRWDRFYKIPIYIIRRLLKILSEVSQK